MTSVHAKTARPGPIAIGLLLFLASCASTTRSIYEGDVRFEHCYRLDDEQRVTVDEKRRCWLDWSDKYTYGQTRDRMSYAASRGRALGQMLAAGSITMAAAAPVSPEPSSVLAPPPPAAADEGRALHAARAPGDTLAKPSLEKGRDLAPGAACRGPCETEWMRCGAECQAASCRSVCDERYRGCMRACF